jgi:hypothetical protein
MSAGRTKIYPSYQGVVGTRFVRLERSEEIFGFARENVTALQRVGCQRGDAKEVDEFRMSPWL